MRIGPLYNQLSALSFGKAVARSLNVAQAPAVAGTSRKADNSTAASRAKEAGALVERLRTLVAAPPEQSAAAERETQQLTSAAAAVAAPARRELRSQREVSHEFIAGANAAQLNAEFSTRQRHAALVVSGEVTRAADTARLSLVGAEGAVAAGTSQFELSGNSGSISLSVTAGESLHDVAARVNLQTTATGVSAYVSGNKLELSSTQIGANASVRLQPVNVLEDSLDGVNAAQVSAFTASSQVIGETEEISGTVISAAAGATLTYQGAAGGTVAGTATFRLTGERGSTEITLTAGESLADVADRINLQATSTGVVATVNGENLTLSSDSVGASTLVRVDEVERAEQVSVTGRNESQISSFTVNSLDIESTHVVSGNVIRTASHATLTLAGAGNATVVDSAEFELVGNLGSTNISIEQGESLTAVAQRINEQTGNTGAIASVDGNELVIQSVGVGSAAAVEVHLIEIDYDTQVSGVNAAQLSNFTVDSINNGASQTISGNITQQASKAKLTYTGLAGLVATTANFTLTGSLGSRTFSASFVQSLSSLASNVNAQSANTGVTATVVGSSIEFRSAGVGTAATVAVNVNSGSFNVTGGNGNGTANGTNAQATINGQARTATSANTFNYTTATGAYTFTAATGFTGTFSTVSINSIAGEFDLSGGDPAGAAQGLDALAEINGEEVTGSGNQFVVEEEGAEFALEFAAGFEGEFAAVTVQSTLASFEVSGANEAGADYGSDFVVEVNGQQFTNTTSHVTLVGEHGTYDIDFVAGFTGQFDTITASKGGTATIEDADSEGRAFGGALTARVNGEEKEGNGNEVRHVENGIEVTLQFQAGFIGQFDSITFTHYTESRVRATQITEPFTGATAAANSHSSPPEPTTSDAVASTLAEIEAVTDAVDGERTAASASPAATEVTRQTKSLNDVVRSLASANLFSPLAALESLANNTQRIQRQRLIDLLG